MKRDLYASEGLEDLNPDVNMDLDPNRSEEYAGEADRIYNQRYRNYYKDKFEDYKHKIDKYLDKFKSGYGRLRKSLGDWGGMRDRHSTGIWCRI